MNEKGGGKRREGKGRLLLRGGEGRAGERGGGRGGRRGRGRGKGRGGEGQGPPRRNVWLRLCS